MYRISCFADEISPDINEQIDFLMKNKIRYIEFRSMWHKNVLELGDLELKYIKKRLASQGIEISSIGSPIGKVDIHIDFEKYLDDFRRAVEIALKMGSEYIRIFSFFMKKEELDQHESTVVKRLEVMISIAKENGLLLLHENDAEIYGESSIRCKKLFDSLDRESFRAVFDPSNFVVAGEDVVGHSFPVLKPYIEYVHIKDSRTDTKEIVVAGKGDGGIRNILSEMRHKDNMFLSLEPHLLDAGKYKGFTGPVLFQEDLIALVNILNELGIEYS